MNPEEKQWFQQHGTPAEQNFVTSYGDRRVSTGSILTSLLYYAGFAAIFFLVVGGYLYVSRTMFLRPVTGTWVGFFTDESNKTGTAIFLDTSVNPLQIFRPALAGSVRMCIAHTDQDFRLERTRTVSADTLGIEIASRTSPESGRLFGALRDGEFQAIYNRTARVLQGRLRRGTRADYQQNCESHRS